MNTPTDITPPPSEVQPTPRKHHKVRKTLLIIGAAIVALIVLVVVITAVGGKGTPKASPTTSSVTSAPATPTAPTPSASSSGYPQEAADQALCTTYQTLIPSGDIEGIQAAVAEAGDTVTPSLAADMLRVANTNGTIQQDEQNQVYVAMDCGIVSAGRQPVELNK
jgi:hypothetical protein